MIKSFSISLTILIFQGKNFHNIYLCVNPDIWKRTGILSVHRQSGDYVYGFLDRFIYSHIVRPINRIKEKNIIQIFMSRLRLRNHISMDTRERIILFL